VARAEGNKPVNPPVSPRKAAAFSLICPGCGHFYLDQPGQAAAFLAPAVALGGGGIALLLDKPELGNPDDPALEADDPIAFQMVMATQNLYFYSIFAAYRDARALRPDLHYEIPVSQESLGDLASAPFSPSVLARPWVWLGVPVAVGAALGLTALLDDDGLDGDERTLFDEGDVNFLGRRTSKAAGVTLGEIYLAALFTPVAVGEEALFRGFLQPILSERVGVEGGWALTTLAFGAVHVLNYVEEDVGTAAAAVSFITAVGGYIGIAHVQTGYTLATPVAIHFWYDFLLSTAVFIADPDHAPFVARVALPW